MASQRPESGQKTNDNNPSPQALAPGNRTSGYLLLGLLLSLLLVAVGLGVQAGPAHLLWFQSAVRGAAL